MSARYFVPLISNIFTSNYAELHLTHIHVYEIVLPLATDPACLGIFDKETLALTTYINFRSADATFFL